MKQTSFNLVGWVLCLTLLLSCGGNDDTTAARQALIDAADAKEAEARRHAVDTPCTQAAHCAYLGFGTPASQCSDSKYAVYSTISATAAAASAAAAEQISLSRQAQALYSGPVFACPAGVPALPTLACVASRCQPVN
jgi:hypothetical protein